MTKRPWRLTVDIKSLGHLTGAAGGSQPPSSSGCPVRGKCARAAGRRRGDANGIGNARHKAHVSWTLGPTEKVRAETWRDCLTWRVQRMPTIIAMGLPDFYTISLQDTKRQEQLALRLSEEEAARVAYQAATQRAAEAMNRAICHRVLRSRLLVAFGLVMHF